MPCYVYNTYIYIYTYIFLRGESDAAAVPTHRLEHDILEEGGRVLLTEIPLPLIARQGTVSNFNTRINSTSSD